MGCMMKRLKLSGAYQGVSEKKENKLMKWFYNTSFMRSLDLNRTYFYVLMLDILFLIFFLLTIGLFKTVLNIYISDANVIAPQAEKVFKFMSDSRIKPTPEVIEDVYKGVFLLGDTLKRFLWKTILTLTLLVTFIIFLVSLLKGYAWKRIKREGFNKKYLIKLFIANFLWYWGAIILLIWFLIFLRQPFGIILAHVEIVLFIYLATLLHVVFNENNSIWNNTKKVLYYGILKLHKFLPVVLYFFFFFIIIILFSGVLFSLPTYVNIYLSFETVLLILIFLFIMEIAWVKFYYYETYKKYRQIKQID